MFVGIVCPDSLRTAMVEALVAKGVRYSDAGMGGLGASINLVSPHDAKGLEFDSVVVVEPTAIVQESAVLSRPPTGRDCSTVSRENSGCPPTSCCGT